MTCPDCERYKQSAAMWRNKAYELGGTPLPWKRDELWVGLTPKEELDAEAVQIHGVEAVIKWVEAKLKEKNT